MKSNRVWTVAAALIMITCCFYSKVNADCSGGLEGNIVAIKVKTCSVIVPAENEEIQKSAQRYRNLYDPEQLNKIYTGALVTDEQGTMWMYPSESADPCKDFKVGEVVQKKGYSTCCDTGKWGKCVFGGRWLSDADGRPINSFQ